MHITVESGATLHLGTTATQFPDLSITIKAGGTVVFDVEIPEADITKLRDMKTTMDQSFQPKPK